MLKLQAHEEISAKTLFEVHEYGYEYSLLLFVWNLSFNGIRKAKVFSK